MYTPIKKGSTNKTKIQPKTPDFVGSVDGVVKMVREVEAIKRDMVASVESKLSEISSTVEEIRLKAQSIEDGKKEIDNTAQEIEAGFQRAIEIIGETKDEAINVIREIKKGDKGDPADETKIIEEILAKLPKPVDEKALTKKILASLPDPKTSLKIIQEQFTIDPETIIAKIMEKPEKLKLKVKDIEGLDQTIAIIRNQLGKGYLHGGGLAKVTTDATLTGDGTPQNPLHATGGGGGHVIQDEGVSLPQRSKLNFIGTGVTATDNAGADSTDVTISGGGGGGTWTDTSTNTGTNKTLNDLSNYIDADATHLKVKFNLGGAGTVGMPVYGTVWNAVSGATEVSKAKADSSATMPCLGLIEQAGADGSVLEIRTAGILNNVNTNIWSEGTALYVDPVTAGTLTSTRPTGATQLVQKVGIVLRQHATLGVIEVIGAGRANDTPNTISVTGTITGSNLSGTNTGDETGNRIASLVLNDSSLQTTIIDTSLISYALPANASWYKITWANVRSQFSSAVNTWSAVQTFLGGTLGLRNVANTFTSFFTNTNTASRTYTLKDADGTIAFTSDITGTNSGTNTGDVTLLGTPNYITIAGQAITRALIDLTSHVTGKLPFANVADVGTATVMYRKTAGTGSMESQTLATLKTDLGLTGTNSGDQTITLTGEVTGSGTGSFATTVANSAVIGKVLTGLSLVTSQVISATDTVIQAFGYIQAQITALTSTVSGKANTTTTISTTAPLSGGGDLSANRTLTTSMSTNKLIGRGTSGTGVMEEITLGTNLSLTGTTLNATSGGGAGNQTITAVTQTAHGLSVGNVIKSTGNGTYGKAQADTAINADVVGIVTIVLDADHFSFVSAGEILLGVPAVAGGTAMFLSPTVAGGLTSTEPSTVGQISKPVLEVTNNGVSAIILNLRGMEITSPEVSLLSKNSTIVDFGSTPTWAKEFIITDGIITSSSVIIPSAAYEDTTDNTADELEASQILCYAGQPSTGSFKLLVTASDGPISGTLKINYITL